MQSVQTSAGKHCIGAPSTHEEKGALGGRFRLRTELYRKERPFPTHPKRGLGQVVAIEVHHLVPRSHEVFHERLLRVVACIDFSDCPELGV